MCVEIDDMTRLCTEVAGVSGDFAERVSGLVCSGYHGDMMRGRELAENLLVYLACGGNARRASRELYSADMEAPFAALFLSTTISSRIPVLRDHAVDSVIG